MESFKTHKGFDLIAGLFSRVPLWVIYCDDTDKSQASEVLEKQEMVRSLERVEKVTPFSFLRDAVRQAKENLLPDPNETLEDICNDIRKATSFLQEREGVDALDNFSKALRYVGFTVARAYREELDLHEDEFMLESVLNKICGHLNEISDPEEFKNQNISPAEHTALTRIAEALRA